jgi:type IV pilus assembly protein PilN
MIKINLLPVRASKKRELGRQWLVLLALSVVAAVVGNYLWWNQEELALQAVRSRITKYEQDVATLNKIIGEVKNIKKEKAEMEQKLGVLKTLRDGRTGPVRVLDELTALLPQRVWLQSMEEGSGKVTFVGVGSSHEEVANFLKKLKSSKFFSAPVLKNTRQSGENKVDFSITCTVKYSA